MNRTPYTLTFVREGAVSNPGFPRYPRKHFSLRSAQSAARAVAAALEARGISAARHPALIYGPQGRVFSA